MAFEVEEGAVFVKDEERRNVVACNVQGLPFDAFAGLLKALSIRFHAPYVRNARPMDGLPAGAWYVLTPQNGQAETAEERD